MPQPAHEDGDLTVRLAAAEQAARAARSELDRLRRRRAVRVALVLASLRRQPRRALQLPRLLGAALRPSPGGAGGVVDGERKRSAAAPAPPAAAEPGSGTSSPTPSSTGSPAQSGTGAPAPSSTSAAIPPAAGQQPRAADRRTIPDQPPPYPHLDVAQLPAQTTFSGLGQSIAPNPEEWRSRYDGGADLLILEPGGDPGALDAEEVGSLLAACETDGVPSVLLASCPADLGAAWTPDVDLVVTDDPAVAEAVGEQGGRARALLVDPFVDARVFNPVGWQREPAGGVLCVVDAVPATPATGPLGALLTEPPTDLTVRHGPTLTADALPAALQGTARAYGDHDDLARVLRGHRVVLALPELHASEAAFLRHVLAAVACGTPVVAPPSPALARLVPGDAIRFAAGPEEAGVALRELASDPDVRERRSVFARRHVFTHHTVRDRFDAVLEALGIPTAAPERISVVLCTNRPDFLERAIDNVARQHWPHKELVVVLHGDGPDPERAATLTGALGFPSRVVEAPAAWTFGDCLNAGVAATTGDLVAKMDDDDLYGPEHLTDLVAARRYADADVVGKWGQFVYLEERDVTLARQSERQEQLGTHLPGPTFLIPRELLRRFGFSRVNAAIDTALWRRLRAAGGRLYSTHRYNFVRVRHGSHTFQRSDEEFLASADAVFQGLRRDVLDV